MPGASRDHSPYEHIYYLGVIDMLKPFTWYERYFERDLKIYCMCKDPDEISVARPEAYKERFIARMKEYFETPDEVDALLSADDWERNTPEKRAAFKKALKDHRLSNSASSPRHSYTVTSALSIESDQ
jgi:hypothetical protein